MQHLIYSAKYNLIDSIMKKRGIETQNPECLPSHTPFVPVAVQACLLVIKGDPCREVRRQAAQTLFSVIQDRPGRQVPKMLSQGVLALLRMVGP